MCKSPKSAGRKETTNIKRYAGIPRERGIKRYAELVSELSVSKYTKLACECLSEYASLPKMKKSTSVLFSSWLGIRRASVVGPSGSVSVSVGKQNARSRASTPIAADQ